MVESVVGVSLDCLSLVDKVCICRLLSSIFVLLVMKWWLCVLMRVGMVVSRWSVEGIFLGFVFRLWIMDVLGFILVSFWIGWWCFGFGVVE